MCPCWCHVEQSPNQLLIFLARTKLNTQVLSQVKQRLPEQYSTQLYKNVNNHEAKFSDSSFASQNYFVNTLLILTLVNNVGICTAEILYYGAFIIVIHILNVSQRKTKQTLFKQSF